MKLPFTITKKDFRLNVQCKRFLQIGLPLALQECLTQISFLALCAFVNRLGLEASSGYGVACKIVNFAMLVPSFSDAVYGILCIPEHRSGQEKNEQNKSMFNRKSE